MNGRLQYNPYDYLHPVTDRDLFAGRDKELSDIEYYLDEAKVSPRPANIAILGPRAAGKTSLLNIIEQEALDRGFCIARLNLDEDDARSQQAFFFKLFDAIVMAGFEAGAFGGTEGNTYGVYLDMVQAFEIPHDKEFCPFLFPLQYAIARASGRDNTDVSAPSVRRDLDLISAEVARPIVILIDEGNIMSRSKSLLQKLHNLFMNTSGYLLVITGTPELFDVMDDVFSPIVRGFHRIFLSAFQDRRDTEDCIRKPLIALGIRPENALDKGTLQDVAIHRVSGGRPYEIQLMCHEMFRRYQMTASGRMKLDLSVLEEVRRQLETSQDTSNRPVLMQVKTMTRHQLDALRILVQCNDQATLKQLWVTEYVLGKSGTWSIENLSQMLEQFVDRQVLELDSQGKIHFMGDDFDKLYTKYFAGEQGIEINMSGEPIRLRWYRSLVEKVLDLLMPALKEGQQLDLSVIASIVFTTASDVELEAICSSLCTPEASQPASLSRSAGFLADVYKQMWLLSPDDHIRFVTTSIKYPWLSLDVSVLLGGSNAALQNTVLDEALREFQSISEKVAHFDGQMSVHDIVSTIPSKETLVQSLVNLSDGHVKSSIFSFHAEMVSRTYRDILTGHLHYGEGMAQALEHAGIALMAADDLDISGLNNIGYLYMKAGKPQQANDVFLLAANRTTGRLQPEERRGSNQSIGRRRTTHTAISTRLTLGGASNRSRSGATRTARDSSLALISYNLAIVSAHRGNLDEAVEWLNKADVQIHGASDQDRKCFCLLVPTKNAGTVKYPERQDVDLAEAISEARKALEI